MADRYLTDLADVCRGAGVPVIEMPGWQNRGLPFVPHAERDPADPGRNGSMYQSGRPTHVMNHHTASDASDVDQVTYILNGRIWSPISNLYLSPSGVAWIIAAGPTNTNGAGSAPWAPWVESMNQEAISIEMGHIGAVGVPYPIAQQDACLALNVAFADRYGIPAHHCRAHYEWSSGKIDPRGTSRWSPDGGTWDMVAFRADAAAALPEPEEDPVKYIAYKKSDPDNRPWLAVHESGMVRPAINADFGRDGDGNVVIDPGPWGPIPVVASNDQQYENLAAWADI